MNHNNHTHKLLIADEIFPDHLKKVYNLDIVAGLNIIIKLYGSDTTTVLVEHRLMKV